MSERLPEQINQPMSLLRLLAGCEVRVNQWAALVCPHDKTVELIFGLFGSVLQSDGEMIACKRLTFESTINLSSPLAVSSAHTGNHKEWGL